MRFARLSKEDRDDLAWSYGWDRLLILLAGPALFMNGPIALALRPHVPELALVGVGLALVGVLSTLLFLGIRMMVEERIDRHALNVIRRGSVAAWCFMAPLPVSVWLLISQSDLGAKWFWAVLMAIGCLQLAAYLRLASVHHEHRAESG
jgi:hypothetical protein